MPASNSGTSAASAMAANYANLANTLAFSGGGGTISQSNTVSQNANATAQAIQGNAPQSAGGTPQQLQTATGAGTLNTPAPSNSAHILNPSSVVHDLQVLFQADNLVHSIQSQIQPLVAVHESITIGTETVNFDTVNNELAQIDHLLTTNLFF